MADYGCWGCGKCGECVRRKREERERVAWETDNEVLRSIASEDFLSDISVLAGILLETRKKLKG